MHTSSLQYSAALLLYAMTLAAAATALFGGWGLSIALFILLVWSQVCVALRREAHETAKVEPENNGASLLTGERCGFSTIELLIALVCCGLVVGLLMPAPNETDAMRHAEISMRAVAQAVREYTTEHGSPPPVVVYDDTGNPMHSWRALILPYLGEEGLAAAYRFDEPWNGPNNSQLARYRPWHFRAYYPEQELGALATTVQAVERDGGLLIVEHERFVSNWLEPKVLPEQLSSALREMPTLDAGFWDRGFFVSTYRGRVALYGDTAFQIHPNFNGELTAEMSATGADRSQDRVELGSAERIWHGINAVHLLVFLAVALYPIRWIRRWRHDPSKRSPH